MKWWLGSTAECPKGRNTGLAMDFPKTGKEPGRYPGSFILPRLGGLDQGRISFLDVNLDAVPGVVYDADPSLGVNLDATGVG